MKCVVALLTLCALSTALPAGHATQARLLLEEGLAVAARSWYQGIGDEHDNQFQRQTPGSIAIIGSGINGAAAAYTLAENARRNSKVDAPLITIFEQHPIVGGRITTAQVFGRPELTIDTCAANFNSLIDTCIASLAQDIGLTATPATDSDNGTAIWNGEHFVGFVEDEGFRDSDSQLWSEFKKGRFGLRYGQAPFASERRQIENRYSLAGSSTFKSLSQEVATLNDSLLGSACESKADFCRKGFQGDLYLREVVEAGVRDRFFGNYDDLNELNSVLGQASANSLQSVDGGNLRLVDRLIKLSSARLLLSTRVEQVVDADNATQWNITYTQAGVRTTETFDKVIIAAPLSLANITIPQSAASSVPLVEYADTVVTHFTTGRTLSASFFNTTFPVPQTILTSSTATEAGNKAELPFFSLRLLDNSVSPDNAGRTRPPGQNSFGQNLYKLVSSQPLSNITIASYLEPGIDDSVFTWIHREDLPRSVPRLDRTLKIQGDIEVAPGLFYAGNGAQVTDTIEFACRMGRNAARQVIPDPVRNTPPGNG